MDSTKIPLGIIRLLEEADFMNLATSDRNGQPSAANKFLLKIKGNILYMVDFIKGKTWKNLQDSPLISLTLMDKDNLRDYQINGTAVVLERGSEYDHLMKELSEKDVRFTTNRIIEGVRRMKPHHNFDSRYSHPAYIIKVRIDEIIEIGPTAQLKKDNKVIISDKKDSMILGIRNRFVKKAQYYFSQYRGLTRLAGVSLVLIIGAIDYLTGYEIGVSSFYLIPIIMVTWGLNKKAGFYVVFLSVATWIVAEQMARGINFPFFIIFWNASIRLTFFSIIVQLLSSLKIMIEKEQELSSHDYLTGAVNSRYFYELIDKELKRMSRGKNAFTLAYIDIDNFKRINDEGGHLVGDSLLKLIGATLKTAIREIDIVGRLGGDEFAVFLPLTGYEGAQTVITRISDNLKKTMLQYKWEITSSIGVVTCNEPPATVDEIVGLADAQMYIAKRSGKNTVKHAIFRKQSA